ncbi:hypothetical protein C1H46_035055 [Malus baccata]|uniref:Uncharacterized protein n=1 Tax=Malus baccata TaxID=106549 RepID=A0A540KYU8_MALBA|nr:hypothetical protein C1H46_035055 [Malus baccata]
MEREEKGSGSERKKQGGVVVKKLKRGVLVRKRGGLCSTPPPIWRLVDFCSQSHRKPTSEFLNPLSAASVSARKLCSSVWEIEQMSKGGGGLHRKQRSRNGVGISRLLVEAESPAGSTHDQPASASSLRRLVSAPLIQNHQSVESNGCALQPLSPASCSSLEFANGIKEYEQEVRSLKQKPEKGHSGNISSDRLILHLSEAWLDERMQMKMPEAQSDHAERNTIVDKLGFDIETFLQAKRSIETKKNRKLSPKELKGNCSRRQSLESFPLNQATSAPQHVADEDSTDNDSHSVDVSKSASGKQVKRGSRQRKNNVAEGQYEGIARSNSVREKVSQENTKANSLCDLQGQFEERMTKRVSYNANRSQSANREHGEIVGVENQALIDNLEESEYCDLITGLKEIQSKRLSTRRMKSSHPESNCRVETCVQPVHTGNASPVQQWISKLRTPDFGKSQSSWEWPPGLDENTLMAKLLEARLEAKRSRMKTSKGPL